MTAGIKLLENQVVLNPTTVKGNQSKEDVRITNDFKKHAQRAYRALAPEIRTKTRNKKSGSIQIPIQ